MFVRERLLRCMLNLGMLTIYEAVCFPHLETCDLHYRHCNRSMSRLQMTSSADLRAALEGAQSDSPESLLPEVPEVLPTITALSTADQPDAAVVHHHVDSSIVQQQQEQQQEQEQQREQKLEASLAAAADSSTSVTSLVHHFEGQSAAVQPPWIDFLSAEWSEPDRPTSRRPRLTPLLIDDDLVLHTAMPAMDAADEVSMHVRPGSSSPGAVLQAIESLHSMPSAVVATPRARHQSAVQDATARNQAAIAAHRARLKEHSTASTPHSAAARHGWATPFRKAVAPFSPAATPRRISLHAAPQSPSRVRSPTAGSPMASPRASLVRFGSLVAPGSLRSAKSPPVALRRGGSVLIPSSSSETQRRTLDLAQGHRLSPSRGKSVSPMLQRGASATVAAIMKQNSRLPPLDLVPASPSPMSPRSTLRTLPPLRRGSSMVTPVGMSPPLKRGSSVGTSLQTGVSTNPAAAKSSSALSPCSSPERWSEPQLGSAPTTPRRSSVAFSPEVRRNIRLSPISPRRSGSGIPSGLLRGSSGVPRSPNRYSLLLAAL